MERMFILLSLSCRTVLYISFTCLLVCLFSKCDSRRKDSVTLTRDQCYDEQRYKVAIFFGSRDTAYEISKHEMKC